MSEISGGELLSERSRILVRRDVAANNAAHAHETIGFGATIDTLGGMIVTSPSLASEIIGVSLLTCGAYLTAKGLVQSVHNFIERRREEQNLRTYDEFEGIMRFNDLD